MLPAWKQGHMLLARYSPSITLTYDWTELGVRKRAAAHGKGDQGAHQAQEGEHYDEEDSQTVEAVHERSALPVARVASHHGRWHHLCSAPTTRG
jgi:hypothetical protein